MCPDHRRLEADQAIAGGVGAGALDLTPGGARGVTGIAVIGASNRGDDGRRSSALRGCRQGRGGSGAGGLFPCPWPEQRHASRPDACVEDRPGDNLTRHQKRDGSVG